jgi:hypothetical protein
LLRPWKGRQGKKSYREGKIAERGQVGILVTITAGIGTMKTVRAPEREAVGTTKIGREEKDLTEIGLLSVLDHLRPAVTAIDVIVADRGLRYNTIKQLNAVQTPAWLFPRRAGLLARKFFS